MIFEHEGDTYNFEKMTVKMWRGFHIYLHRLVVIDQIVYRKLLPIDTSILRPSMDQTHIKCEDQVQEAYQSFLATKILLGL
jgi:hypothetical protein